VLRNHSIVRKRRLKDNKEAELAIIEQGNFRKLEREYESILGYSNSTKDLSLVKTGLEQHEERIKTKLNVIEQDTP